jgi:hypothetical protein
MNTRFVVPFLNFILLNINAFLLFIESFGSQHIGADEKGEFSYSPIKSAHKFGHQEKMDDDDDGDDEEEKIANESDEHREDEDDSTFESDSDEDSDQYSSDGDNHHDNGRHVNNGYAAEVCDASVEAVDPSQQKQTQCACTLYEKCSFPKECNIMESKHRCSKCYLKIGGTCLTGDEEEAICRYCSVERSPKALDISAITTKSSESGKSKKVISKVFTITTDLQVKKCPIIPMTFVGVRYRQDHFIYLISISEKKKKKAFHLVFDPVNNSIHHVCASNITIPENAEKPTKEALINANNSLTIFMERLKTVKEFPVLPNYSRLSDMTGARDISLTFCTT